MTDNKTASAKSDATKTENLPETTTKETLPPSPAAHRSRLHPHR